jgi:hypothetical protein
LAIAIAFCGIAIGETDRWKRIAEFLESSVKLKKD